MDWFSRRSCIIGKKYRVVQRTPSVHYYWQELSNETLFFIFRDSSGFILYSTCSETFQYFRNKEVIFSEFIYRYKRIFKMTCEGWCYIIAQLVCNSARSSRRQGRIFHDHVSYRVSNDLNNDNAGFVGSFQEFFRFLMIFVRQLKDEMHKFLKLKDHFETWHGWTFVIKSISDISHQNEKEDLN